jgi:tRNA (guanine37-N1)-methyltransferase
MNMDSLNIQFPPELGPIYPETFLDKIKSKFETKVVHPAIIIPVKLTAKARTMLKGFLLNKPKMKDVYSLEESESIDSIDFKMERKIVLANRENIYDHESIQSLLADAEHPTIRKSTHEVVIGYDHLSLDEVLRQLLPKDVLEVPSSFEVVGCLAHMNLRDDVLPYKHIIGRVILDKNKGIQVVVNKIGTIQNEFRTFPMEILSDNRGHSNNGFEVEVKEDNCKFKLDFSKVYWNSRLQHEHRRLVRLISGKSRLTNVEKRFVKDDMTKQSSKLPKVVVADACAGIGPFAIPLSQLDHVDVHANDLNPISYKYLNLNAALNKCKRLQTYNMDGRDFIRMLDERKVEYHHVLMNLPAIAPEFLNVFRGWEGNYSNRPMIHVHCFASKDNGETEAVKRCSESLGCKLDMQSHEVSVHEVRNVSPKKNMYCVSFRLPEDVRNVEKVQTGSFRKIEGVDNDDDDNGISMHDSEPISKKQRSI